MLATLFLIAVLGSHTFSSDIEDPRFDDIDGPKFLRGAEQEPVEEKDLDSPNHWSRELSEDSSDSYITSSASHPHEKMVCNVASHSAGTETWRWKEKAIDATNEEVKADCLPQLTVVQLKTLKVARPYPSHIKLHRCMGLCMADGMNCTVTKQNETVIKVHDIFTGANVELVVFNHTACQCHCIKRESDCNTSIHDYDVSSCKCKCKPGGSRCSANQSLDQETCQCKCKHNQNHCPLNHYWNGQTCRCECLKNDNCPPNQFWNDGRCKCQVCQQKVKNRCVRKGKVFNQTKCQCDCPKPQPVCGTGTSFVKHNCTCV